MRKPLPAPECSDLSVPSAVALTVCLLAAGGACQSAPPAEQTASSPENATGAEITDGEPKEEKQNDQPDSSDQTSPRTPSEIADTLQQALAAGDADELGAVLPDGRTVDVRTETRVPGQDDVEPVTDDRSLEADALRTWVDDIYQRYDDVVGLPPADPASDRERVCKKDCCRGDLPSELSDDQLVVRRVCVAEQENGSTALASVEFVATLPVPVPDGVSQLREVVPSPDRTRWLVVGGWGSRRNRPPARVLPEQDIWLYEPSSGSMERLTDNKLSEQPDWAPDGRRFVYQRNEGIAIQNLDTGKVTMVREADIPDDPRGEYDYTEYTWPEWGPKGRYLVFYSTNGGVATAYLYDLRNDCRVAMKTARKFHWTEDGEVELRKHNHEKGEGRIIATREQLDVDGCAEIEVD